MSVRSPWEKSLDRSRGIEVSTGAAAHDPTLHEARLGGLSYETFYGLKEKAFSLSSDSRFFYHSRSHAPAFEDLLASIRRRESLNVLTGDIGTGKTTLCRAVLQDLDRKTFSAFVPDPFASREDLLKVVLMDFGVLSADDLTSGRLKGASRTELSYLLYEFLGTLAPLQAFAVVIIDEAQNLSVPLLEEIRILSDSDGRDRQLQVVLVGQLELREKLKLPEMRQVDQRVSVHCRLAPLGSIGVAGYIAHRLQVAGGSPDRVQFSRDAAELVFRASGGVPRLINRICDRALHHGYVKRAATIDEHMIEAAIADAGQFAPAPPPAAHRVAPAPVPAPPPVSVPPAHDIQDDEDPVDEWLALMEADVDATRKAAASRRPASWPVGADVLRTDRLSPQPAVAATVRGHATRQTPREIPQTQVERFTSRWARRLGIAAMCMVGIPVAAVGGLYLWNLSTDVWELTLPLAPPPLPPERPLVLAPALKLPALPEALPDATAARDPNTDSPAALPREQ